MTVACRAAPTWTSRGQNGRAAAIEGAAATRHGAAFALVTGGVGCAGGRAASGTRAGGCGTQTITTLDGANASMSESPELPELPGVTRRQFLEDLLDVMGDADRIVSDDPETDPMVVYRIDLLTALAEEMDR